MSITQILVLEIKKRDRTACPLVQTPKMKQEIGLWQYFLFMGLILNLLGLILFDVDGQIMKNNQVIWSQRSPVSIQKRDNIEMFDYYAPFND